MTFQSELLRGQAALVTGGGTGICRGIALALAALGCDVAVVDRAVVDIDLKGTFHVSRAAFPHLKTRGGSIDDVSNAVVFLCSGAASFVTGVTMVVDGGLWLHSDRMAASLAAATAPEGRS